MYNEYLEKCNKTTEELNKVKVSEVKLTARVDDLSERVINQTMLENDDKMAKFYTGLKFYIIFSFKSCF